MLAAAARAALPFPPPGKPPQEKASIIQFPFKELISSAAAAAQNAAPAGFACAATTAPERRFRWGKREFWGVFLRLQPFKPLHVEIKEVKKPPDKN